METSFNLKLNNYLTNMKNKFSSIFSRLFKRKNKQNDKIIEKDEKMAYKNSEKSAKNKNCNKEFVNIVSKENNINNRMHEKGVIPPFLIKIIVSIVIVLIVTITLFTLFYIMVSKASLDFNVEKLAEYVREFFVMLFYSIAKWILCIVDIVFSYVRSLCGLNMDFTSLNGIFSAQSDIVFNLLLTSGKRATQIFRNLVALAIIMIIIFTIIALVKSQLLSMRTGKPASVMDTIKKTIRAFILLLITPFLAIGGIVFSDLLLQTLFRATNTTNSSTLGTQIFATAAVSSNAYRNYAINNGRIPITCDFTKEKDILEYYSHNSPSETFTEYLRSSNNLIYVTFMSFINNDFLLFSDLNDIVIPTNADNREKAYYGIYDIKPGGTKYERIETYAEEYYVMADVIDFGVNTGNTLYIKDIEAVLDSVCEISDETLREKTFNLMVQRYGLKFYEGNKEPGAEVKAGGKTFISCDLYMEKSWNFISYSSYYISPSDSGTPENPMQIRYYHIKGTHDEIDGAKYIIAYQNTIQSGDITYTYYEPMTNGFVDRYDISFNSEYIEDGQIIAAKGDFKDAIYPTAIKETILEDTTQITFYREDLEAVAVGAMNEIFRANLNDDGDTNWFTNFLRMIQMFFQPDSIIGEITYNPEVIQASYSTKGIAVVNNIESGRIKVGYFLKFKPSSPDMFSGGRSISLKEIFDPQKFDIILILVAPIILCRVGMISIFALIQRAYELFLIILTYPAACAAIPYEEKGYVAWWDEYFNRLFATYGIILGINFVLALFPIIGKIEYFTPGEIATNKILYKVTHLFFGFLTITQITNLLNTLVVILFELVAFTLLDPERGVPHLISEMLGRPDLKGEGFIKSMQKLVSRVKNTIKAIGKAIKVAKIVIVGIQGGISTAMDAVKKPEEAKKRLEEFKKKKMKLLPGSKFLDTLQRNSTGRATRKAMRDYQKNGGMSQDDLRDPGEKPKKPKESEYVDEKADEETKQKQKQEYENANQKYEEDLNKWQEDKEKYEQAKIAPLKNIVEKQKLELAALGEKTEDNSSKKSGSKKSSEGDDKKNKKDGKSKKKMNSNGEEDNTEDKENKEKKDETESENSKENSMTDSGDTTKDPNEEKDNDVDNNNDNSEDKDDDNDEKDDKDEDKGNSSKNESHKSSQNNQEENNGSQGNQDNSDNKEEKDNTEDKENSNSNTGSNNTGSNNSGDSNDSENNDKEDKQHSSGGFNPDDYGNRGLEDEMKDTQKKHRDEGRKQDALERQLAEQEKNGDKEGAKRTQKLIDQSKQRQKELDDYYFKIYAAQQDRFAEEQRIMQTGTDEEKQQLAMKNRMRTANDEQRFADKEARGETTSARIKSFAAGVASNVGNSIKNKVTSTASGIWNRHLERRNERWANAFTNTKGNVFKKIGRAAYRGYVEQRMGGFARKNEYENINRRLNELNSKYTHPENFDKNSQEYKDYITEKTALEKRRDKLEADFNTLSGLKLQRTMNKTEKVNRVMSKIIGNPDDYAEYEDTSTLYRKLRAIRHPLKTLRAKTATAFMNSDKKYTSEQRDELQKEIETLKHELGQIDGSPRNAQNQRRKQQILTELNHLAPLFAAYKQTDDFYKRWDNQTFSKKLDHIKEDAIVYGEDKKDDDEE